MHNAIIIEQWRSVKSREITVYVKCHYESVNIRRLDTAGSGTFRFYTIDRRYQIRKQNFCGYATIDRQKFSQLFENTQHISFFSLFFFQYIVKWYYKWYDISNITTWIRYSKFSFAHGPQISFSNKINSFANQYQSISIVKSILRVNYHYHHHRRRRYYH